MVVLLVTNGSTVVDTVIILLDKAWFPLPLNHRSKLLIVIIKIGPSDTVGFTC